MSQSVAVRKTVADIVAGTGGLAVAGSGPAGRMLGQLADYRPELVLIDSAVGHDHAVRTLVAQARLLRPRPPIAVLDNGDADRDLGGLADAVIAMSFDTGAVGRALQCLASGVITTAAQYGGPDDPPHAAELSRRLTALTRRELEILRLLVEGCSNQEMSRQLSISNYTVKEHVSGILRKLEVTSRMQAAVIAVRAGLP